MRFKKPLCPLCGGKPTVSEVKYKQWAHLCPKTGRMIWWTEIGLYSTDRFQGPELDGEPMQRKGNHPELGKPPVEDPDPLPEPAIVGSRYVCSVCIGPVYLLGFEGGVWLRCRACQRDMAFPLDD